MKTLNFQWVSEPTSLWACVSSNAAHMCHYRVVNVTKNIHMNSPIPGEQFASRKAARNLTK
ncbi:hypothetical protein QQ056_08905 [Oscillatoria laete-virens NRMC-F 0139]|nr:hypothetical protein [Oscillatoria laete-virens]MDL5053661.1 hypothetical protein [Oscillatoria laete-virens NRMC-F 0139]